jgi:hypothetical protein
MCFPHFGRSPGYTAQTAPLRGVFLARSDADRTHGEQAPGLAAEEMEAAGVSMTPPKLFVTWREAWSEPTLTVSALNISARVKRTSNVARHIDVDADRSTETVRWPCGTAKLLHAT